MKKTIFSLIIIPFIFFGCNRLEDVSISTEKKKCEEDGGKWQKAGKAQIERCIHSFSDAGKECTSSDECQSGECVVSRGDEERKIGNCKGNDNPFGCYATIEMGFTCFD